MENKKFDLYLIDQLRRWVSFIKSTHDIMVPARIIYDFYLVDFGSKCIGMSPILRFLIYYFFPSAFYILIFFSLEYLDSFLSPPFMLL